MPLVNEAATGNNIRACQLGRIYYARTRDFVTLRRRSFISGVRTTNSCSIRRSSRRTTRTVPSYVRVSGDGIFEASDDLLGTWRRIGDLGATGLAGQVEGPILFRFNGTGEWGLWMDQYKATKGYLPLVARDLARPDAFKILAPERYSLGKLKKRHGSVLNINRQRVPRAAGIARRRVIQCCNARASAHAAT